MRRLTISFSSEDRLRFASDFLKEHEDKELVLIAPTRAAADELVRSAAMERRGVFGVHRFTLPQLAFMLASERSAQNGQTFATGVAMDAIAARAVQAVSTNGKLRWFEPVASTPGFFRALASTIDELRLNHVDPAVLEGAGPAGEDLGRLLREFESSLQHAQVADLAAAYKLASAATAEPTFRFAGRPLLLLDLNPTSKGERDLLYALSRAATSVLATVHSRNRIAIDILESALEIRAESVAGPQMDRAIDRFRAHVFESTSVPGDLDSSIEFISATDEGRESVEIARSIVALVRQGTRFDEMAIVLRNPEVYQPSIEDALRRAGIPACFSMGARRPNAAGRAMLALLACAAEGLSATRFSEYLSLGQVPKPEAAPPQWMPVQGELFPEIQPSELVEPPDEEDVDEDTPVISGSLRTPYQWERLLVDAAVIGGRDRWLRRLNGLANEFKKQFAEARDDDNKRRVIERQLQRLGNLRTFAMPLINALAELPDSALWNEWLEKLEALATKALRQPELVLAVLAELRPMRSLGPVSLDEVREVLTDRLTFLRTESPERRYGKVLVTTPWEISGVTFEVVFLPGLAEDNFPKKAFEDPLLLDAARQVVSPWLLTQSTRIARERLLLHITGGAARRLFWISFPRMDIGQGRARNPSFYALDVVRAITGKVPSLEELQRGSALHTPSQLGWPAPRDARVAIDDAEYDLAVISDILREPEHASKGRARYLVDASPTLARSLRTRAGRWRAKWTDGDGIVAHQSDAAVVDALTAHRMKNRSYSATALQHYAACPYRFVLYALHRIQPREEIVAIERIDALTRGSLFHEAQFRLLTELRGLNLLPVTSDVTTIADRIFDAVAEEYREQLSPAIPRIWESQVEDIRWDLRGWLRELQRESGDGWVPRWFELSFGLPKERACDPASQREPVELPSGVHVRGAIDMIEEREGAIRITDHKTGRALTRHPVATAHGEVLQPTLYAQAAEILLGKPAQSGRLFYCTERGGYQSFEIKMSEESRKSLGSVLRLIDESIGEGFMPAAPRKDACVYCDYRVVCGPYEETRIRRKSKERLTLLNDLRETP